MSHVHHCHIWSDWPHGLALALQHFDLSKAVWNLPGLLDLWLYVHILSQWHHIQESSQGGPQDTLAAVQGTLLGPRWPAAAARRHLRAGRAARSKPAKKWNRNSKAQGRHRGIAGRLQLHAGTWRAGLQVRSSLKKWIWRPNRNSLWGGRFEARLKIKSAPPRPRLGRGRRTHTHTYIYIYLYLSILIWKKCIDDRAMGDSSVIHRGGQLPLFHDGFQACYGKKSAFVFDKPGVGYNCPAPSCFMVDSPVKSTGDLGGSGSDRWPFGPSDLGWCSLCSRRGMKQCWRIKS